MLKKAAFWLGMIGAVLYLLRPIRIFVTEVVHLIRMSDAGVPELVFAFFSLIIPAYLAGAVVAVINTLRDFRKDKVIETPRLVILLLFFFANFYLLLPYSISENLLLKIPENLRVLLISYMIILSGRLILSSDTLRDIFAITISLIITSLILILIHQKKAGNKNEALPD